MLGDNQLMAVDAVSCVSLFPLLNGLLHYDAPS